MAKNLEQKILATDAIKTALKRAEATGDLIGNKTANKRCFKKIFSKIAIKNNEVIDESEAPKERYISPKKGNKLLMS